MNPILSNLINGCRMSLARAITIVENNFSGKQEILRSIRSKLGRAHVVGVTGPPGVGKSTLIDACIPEFRKLGQSVAVIAVDPSSHVSGGAILGDRVRMAQYGQDNGVFIRSVAARGHLGGLTTTAREIVDLFDATRWDKIIVETVGAGQSEIEIAQLADTLVVLEAPGLGDEIQSIKAGLIEVADFVVVNKADKPKSDLKVNQLQNSIDLRYSEKSPTVLKTIATTGKGVAELVHQINHHILRLESFPRNRTAAEQNRKVVARIVAEAVERAFQKSAHGSITEITRLIQSGELDVDDLARKMIESILEESASSGRTRATIK